MEKIGPWKLGDTLGLGSTGKVQLAHHVKTNQKAAIKIINKSVFDKLSSEQPTPYGIEREIIIMKLLNHQNVLKLYDVWETDNNLYMVLEYAERGELFNLLVERGPLPEAEAIRFFRQIIIGISYCHALGIVHRDLKPENVLLDHHYNIKLADFGMAALETNDKLLETSCGSPHYAAPEIVSGLPYHGLETDIWSCGVILFALLTGRLPFDEEDGNIRNLLLKVQKGEFEMPGDDEISKDAQDLIRRILTVDPKKRIKSREILQHPLLQKYPNIKDSQSIRNLPRADTYLKPLEDSKIDDQILQNLIVLWHGRDSKSITEKLLEEGPNPEKTMYALLYRFKMETNHEMQDQKKVTPVKTKNNRNSVISVSSSHKRPVSFHRLSTHSSSIKTASTPASSRRLSMSSKRLSKLIDQNINSSPTPRGSKRFSIAAAAEAPPPVPLDLLKDYSNKNKRKSGKRVSVLMKRGSITTKLISTYAKLNEDDDWEYIEKETRRVSSDFATLIDEIFEHEKYEQIKREKEELERKVKEQKLREEQERLAEEREEFELQQKLLKEQEESENAKQQEKDEVQMRSVSEPTPRDGDAMHTQTRNFSLQTRPVSRLDPGIFGNNNMETKLEKEKKVLETIRRSKFLGSTFDVKKELQRIREQELELQEKLKREHDTKQILSKSSNGYKKNENVSKLSEINVPQFTRKSKFFSESNRRMSVLSMYSTKQSFTNLADMLRETGNRSADSEESTDDKPEFLFETVNEETESTVTDAKLYEVPEEDKIEKSIKLNFADRFKEASTKEEPVVILPELPPLNDNSAQGLGIHRNIEEANVPVEEVSKNVVEESQEEEKPHKVIEEVVSSVKKDVEKGPLNDKMPKRRDLVKESNETKKRNGSFLRMFSRNGSSSNDTMLAQLNANVSSKQLFTGLTSLLKGWSKYGLREVHAKSSSMTITGKLASDNILSLRSTQVELTVLSRGKAQSVIEFRKKSGSSKAVKRLAKEIEAVLRKEQVLA